MLEPFRHVLVACVIPGVPCLGLDLCLGRLGGGVALVVAIGPRALSGGAARFGGLGVSRSRSLGLIVIAAARRRRRL